MDLLDEDVLLLEGECLVDDGVVGVDVSLLLQDVKTFLHGLLVPVQHSLVLLRIKRGVRVTVLVTVSGPCDGQRPL